MKKAVVLLLAAAVIAACCAALAEEEEQAATPEALFADLADAQQAYYRIGEDERELDDELLSCIARDWKETYLVQDYRNPSGFLDGAGDDRVGGGVRHRAPGYAYTHGFIGLLIIALDR